MKTFDLYCVKIHLTEIILFFLPRKLSDFIRTNKKVTVIGLFGREKGYDSNKAIEIFDYLAQRDIFCMRNSDENSDQATIEGFQDVANNRHSDPKFIISFNNCWGKPELFKGQ